MVRVTNLEMCGKSVNTFYEKQCRETGETDHITRTMEPFLQRNTCFLFSISTSCASTTYKSSCCHCLREKQQQQKQKPKPNKKLPAVADVYGQTFTLHNWWTNSQISGVPSLHIKWRSATQSRHIRALRRVSWSMSVCQLFKYRYSSP